MAPVEMNIDLGELPSEDPEFYGLCTVVNIACGGHAGDDASMRRALRLAKERGVKVAAHPGYPDRENFGRVPMTLIGSDLFKELVLQMDRLKRIAEDEGVEITKVKAHGALYHEIARHLEAADVFLDACLEVFGSRIEIVGLPGSSIGERAIARGLAFSSEGFADRGYDAEGQILPRGMEGALLSGELAAKQALSLTMNPRFQTICVHGDNPEALVTARSVYGALRSAGRLCA